MFHCQQYYWQVIYFSLNKKSEAIDTDKLAESEGLELATLNVLLLERMLEVLVYSACLGLK